MRSGDRRIRRPRDPGRLAAKRLFAFPEPRERQTDLSDRRNEALNHANLQDAGARSGGTGTGTEKREEERWKRILTWYVMQELEKAKQAERVKIEALAKLPEQSEPQAGAAPARLL